MMHLIRELLPSLVVALNLIVIALIYLAHRRAYRGMTPEQRLQSDRDVENDLQNW